VLFLKNKLLVNIFKKKEVNHANKKVSLRELSMVNYTIVTWTQTLFQLNRSIQDLDFLAVKILDCINLIQI